MTKPTPESGNSIDQLLQDRAQFVSWLTRLNSSGDSSPAVPEAVRTRVRADYERRLESVLVELRGHTAAVEEQVEDLSVRAGLLVTREYEHTELLSEAEVRHLVGEYDEGRWDGIRGELTKVLDQVRTELTQTTAEIDRLNEVLTTIRTPVFIAAPGQQAEPEPEPEPEPILLPELGPTPVPPPPAPAAVTAPRPTVPPPRPQPPAVQQVPVAPAPAVEPHRPVAPAPTGATEIPFRPVPPKPAPKPPTPPAKKDDQPGRTLWFPSGKSAEPSQGGGGKLDELAFLKSVTGEPAHLPVPTPKPSRASAGFPRPPEAAPPPAPPAPPPPPPPPPVAEVAPPAKAPPAAEPKDRSGGAGQKTLKCAECGTLNRPTEWYCERCGAELAAL